MKSENTPAPKIMWMLLTSGRDLGQSDPMGSADMKSWLPYRLHPRKIIQL